MSFPIQGPSTSPTWGTTEAQGAGQTSQYGWQTFADNMTPSQLLYEMLYTQDVSNPLLPPPSALQEQIQEPEIPPPRPDRPDQEGDYFEAFQGKLNELADRQGLSEQQKSELMYAALTGTTPQDPQLAQYLTTLNSEVMSEMLAQYPELQENWQPTGTRKDFKDGLKRDYKNAFESALAKKAEELGLTQEQVASLRFAHNNPEFASSENAALLEEIENAALQSVIEERGLPSSFKPEVDNSAFMANIVSDYDAAFLSALDVYAEEHQLSQRNIDQIKYLHYHPEVGFSEMGPVPGALREIEASVLQDLGAEWGFPSNFKPQPNTFSFDAMINGNFQTELHAMLNNQSPPLTQAKIDAVINYMKNPEGAVDPEIKSLYNQVFGFTVAKIKQMYHLPETWTPQVSSQSLATIHPTAVWGQRMIGDMEEKVINLQALVASMPDGARKMSYINAIKMITEALSTLKEMIFIIQMKDSELGQMYAQMQKDATLNKIAEQERKMKKMEKKRKKMKTLGPLMDIMKAFTYTLLILTTIMPLSFVLIGPVGWAILVGLVPIMISMSVATAGIIAATEVGTKKMWDELENIAMNIGKKLLGLNEAQARVFSDVLKYATITAVLALVSFANPMMGFQALTQATTVFTDVFKAMGASSTTAEMVQMSIDLAIDLSYQIFAFIFMIVVSSVLSGGTAAPVAGAAAVASISAQITTTTAKASLQAIKTIIVKMIKVLVTIAEQMIKKLVQFLQKLILNTGKTLKGVAKVAVKGAAKVAAKGMEKVTTKAQKLILETSVKGVAKGAAKRAAKAVKEILESLPEMIIGAMQTSQSVAQSANQAVQSINRAQLAMIQGDLDAYMEEMEAFIKIIKKVVENLMNGLQGLGSWAADVGQLQQQMWSGRSSAISNITSA